jgi:putative membrane protein
MQSRSLVPVAKRPIQRVGQFCVSVIARISTFIVYVGCKYFTRTGTTVTAEGHEQIPAYGALLFVARHYHHLYDGSILTTIVPRRVHILVALDWIQSRAVRIFMDTFCQLAKWPVVLREERLQDSHTKSAFTRDESKRYMRRGITMAVNLLRDGEALVIFPEAYPNIDPSTSPKSGKDEFLPFKPGFVKIIEIAERSGKAQVAVIPTGFHYVYYEDKKRWDVTVRFGTPVSRTQFTSSQAFAQELEKRVRELSH